MITALFSGSAGSFIRWKLIENTVTAKISSRIKYQYDKSLEDYKLDNLNKQKAALIAELIAEKVSKPADKKLLNKLAFEAFIWLPKELAQKLSLRLTNSPNAPDFKEMLAEVRELLLGNTESIHGESIVHFE